MAALPTRYKAAVERNLAETQRALLNLDLLSGIEKVGGISGNEAKGVYYALFNDYIAHCIKVMDMHKDAASFWYLYRTNKGMFDQAAKYLKVDLAKLDRMAKKLKHIRDKTHFHIDRDGVIDPKSVWRDAGIVGKELAEVVQIVWALLNSARAHLGAEPLERPEVDLAAVTKGIVVMEGGSE